MPMNRITFATVATIVLVITGCSNSASPSGSTSSQPSSSITQSNSPTAASAQPTTSSVAQAGPLDESTCLDIGLTKDNLMVASKPESARSSADTLEKYGPPDPVKAAIEHFVTTVGAQPNDPDLDPNRDLITGWVKQICPNVKP